MEDTGSGKYTLDPQHWFLLCLGLFGSADPNARLESQRSKLPPNYYIDPLRTEYRRYIHLH
jgi:hypothetical protein